MTDKNYNIPSNPEYKTEIRKLRNDDPVNADTIVNPLVEDMLENIHAVKTEQDAYKIEVENKFSALETNIDWKESVNTYEDILKTYPKPDDGWTVNVKDTDYTYRWTGSEWVAISANAIPLATKDVDGKMSKEYAAKLNTIAEKANYYTHPDSGVTAGTYRSVAVDREGHVKSGSNPTTIAGYSISDAYTKGEVNDKLSDLEANIDTGLSSKKNYAYGKMYVSENSNVINYALIAEFDLNPSISTSRTLLLDFVQMRALTNQAWGKLYISMRMSEEEISSIAMIMYVIDGELISGTETTPLVLNYEVENGILHFRLYGMTCISWTGIRVSTDKAFVLSGGEATLENLKLYSVMTVESSTLPETGTNVLPTVKYMADKTDISIYLDSIPIKTDLEIYESRAVLISSDLVKTFTEGKVNAVGRGTIHYTVGNLYDLIFAASPDHVPVFWMVRYYISDKTWIASQIGAPISHASAGTDYGVGNNSNYGHLRLSNRLDDSSGVDGGYAAAPNAVKQLNDTKKSIIRGSYYYNITTDSVFYAKIAEGNLTANNTANISVNIIHNREASSATRDKGFDGRAKIVIRSDASSAMGSSSSFIIESIDRPENFDPEMFFINAYTNPEATGYLKYEIWVKAYGYYGFYSIEVVDTPLDLQTYPLTNFTTYNISGASEAQSTLPEGKKLYLQLSDGVFHNKLNTNYNVTDFDTWNPGDLGLLAKRGFAICHFTSAALNKPPHFSANGGSVEITSITSGQWFIKLYCGDASQRIYTRRGTLNTSANTVTWDTWNEIIGTKTISPYVEGKKDNLWCNFYSNTDASETWAEVAKYTWSAATTTNLNMAFLASYLGSSAASNNPTALALLYFNVRVSSGEVKASNSSFNYYPLGDFARDLANDFYLTIDAASYTFTLYVRTQATYAGYRLDALKDFTARTGASYDPGNLTLWYTNTTNNHGSGTRPRLKEMPDYDLLFQPVKQGESSAKLSAAQTQIPSFTDFDPRILGLNTAETATVTFAVGAAGLPAAIATVVSIGVVRCHSSSTARYSINIYNCNYWNTSSSYDFDYANYVSTYIGGSWSPLAKVVYDDELENTKKEIQAILNENKSGNLWRNTRPYNTNTIGLNGVTTTNSIIWVDRSPTAYGMRIEIKSNATNATGGFYLTNNYTSINAAAMWAVGDWCSWGVWARANRDLYARIGPDVIPASQQAAVQTTLTTEWKYFHGSVKLTDRTAYNAFTFYTRSGDIYQEGDWVEFHSLMVTKSPYPLPYAESQRDLLGNTSLYINNPSWTPDLLNLEIYETRMIIMDSTTAGTLFGYSGLVDGHVTRITNTTYTLTLARDSKYMISARWTKDDGWSSARYTPIDTLNALNPTQITSGLDLNDLKYPAYSNGEWICLTDTNAQNYVTNSPAIYCFHLWVCLLRVGSDTDFVTEQKLVTKDKVEYKRWCTSGVWSDWVIISRSGVPAAAEKLKTARTITLTGDAAGSVTFDGSANTNGSLTLSGSGVTAGSYGPTASVSPAAGSSFTVPQITVDAKGRTTAAANRTITLPAVDMNAIKEQILDSIYPVGAVYLTFDSGFNPNNVFPGTWNRTAKGRALVGIDEHTGREAGDEFGRSEIDLRAMIGAVSGNAARIGYRAADPITGVDYNLATSGTQVTNFGQVNHSTIVYEKDGSKLNPTQPSMYIWVWKRDE